MNYTIEIRVDVWGSDGIPHTFLNVTDSNGTSINYGFAPEQTGLVGNGNVEIQPIPDGQIGHEYSSTSGKIPITEQQYNNLINYINRTDANPYEYNLPLGAQCTVWAMNGLQEAGIIDQLLLPDYDIAMKDPLLGMLQTLFYNPYTQKIGFEVNNLYTSAKNWSPPRADPLVLDLDGDGIETIGIGSAANVLFDHDGDGVKTATGWVKADDGMLVLDRNGNGTIDNGGELFGDQTLVGGVKAANGFAALRAEDSNKNGKFDAGDTNFTKVRIWQDLNQDGISQATELKTLTQAGIASINLGFIASNIANDGNIQMLSGTYIKTDTTSGQVGNYLFTNNAFYRKFTDHLTLTDTAKALPDMQGSGMVRDLQEASTLSAGLTSTLQGMKTTYMTHDEMMVKLDSVLTQWANTSSMLSGRARAIKMRGTAVYMDNYLNDYQLYHKYLWAQQHKNYSILTASELQAAKAIVDHQNQLGGMIDVLERFNASSFSSLIDTFELISKSGVRVGINTSRILEWHANTIAWCFTCPLEISMSSAQSALLKQSYESLKQSVYDGLVLQTRLSGYMDAISLSIGTNGLTIDDSVMMRKLMLLAATNPAGAMEDILEINKYVGGNLSAFGWKGEDSIIKMLEVVDRTFDATKLFVGYGITLVDGVYNGTAASDNILGKQRDDVINAGEGSNTIHSGQGNDTIKTGSGIDIIDGGKGNDLLQGGTGNDTYAFNVGDGIDTIYDYDMRGRSNGGTDTVKFGTGVTSASVALFQSGPNFMLSYGANDLITITNQSVANNAIEKFTLTDGNFLTSNDLNIIIQSMNSYATAHDIAMDSIDTVKANQDLMTIITGAWHK